MQHKYAEFLPCQGCWWDAWVCRFAKGFLDVLGIRVIIVKRRFRTNGDKCLRCLVPVSIDQCGAGLQRDFVVLGPC